MEENHNIVSVFKALCDENRVEVLKLLRNGEMCACELLEELDLGQSGLSYHMKILLASGIVESRAEGKWTHYQLRKEGFAHAIDIINSFSHFQTEPRDLAKVCKEIEARQAKNE